MDSGRMTLVRFALRIAAVGVILGTVPGSATATAGAGCKPANYDRICVLQGEVFPGKKCEFFSGGSCTTCCVELEHVCGTAIQNFEDWRIDGLFSCTDN